LRRKRCDLIGAPHPQRHREENSLELGAIVRGEQAERASFAWLQRRPPQAQQVPLGREFARVCGLAGADVLDGCF
jgi:hypothetical protein